MPVDVCPQSKVEPSLLSEDNYETLRQGSILYPNILKLIHTPKRSYSAQDLVPEANTAACMNLPKKSAIFCSCPSFEISTRKQNEPETSHNMVGTTPYNNQSATTLIAIDYGTTEDIVTPSETKYTTTGELAEPSKHRDFDTLPTCNFVHSSGVRNSNENNTSGTMEHNCAESDPATYAQHNDEHDEPTSGYVCESEYLKSGYICESIYYNPSETGSGCVGPVQLSYDSNISSLYSSGESSCIPVEFLPQYLPLPPSPNETQTGYIQLEDVARHHESNSKPDDQMKPYQSTLSPYAAHGQNHIHTPRTRNIGSGYVHILPDNMEQ